MTHAKGGEKNPQEKKKQENERERERMAKDDKQQS